MGPTTAFPMNLYMYKYQSCSVEFERMQMFSDQSLTRCTECHVGTLRRIPQLPAIIFKGSGWYSIDHRSLSGQKVSTFTKKYDKAGISISAESKN
jgi:putative FmdB family regulatory protein